MEILKKTEQYTVMKKRSGRFCVKDNKGKWVNGAEKVRILHQEGFVKAPQSPKNSPSNN